MSMTTYLISRESIEADQRYVRNEMQSMRILDMQMDLIGANPFHQFATCSRHGVSC